MFGSTPVEDAQVRALLARYFHALIRGIPNQWDTLVWDVDRFIFGKGFPDLSGDGQGDWGLVTDGTLSETRDYDLVTVNILSAIDYGGIR